jgi:hypothetical protein
MGEASSSATWSHDDSSEPITVGKNSGTKMGDGYEMLKFQMSRS